MGQRDMTGPPLQYSVTKEKVARYRLTYTLNDPGLGTVFNGHVLQDYLKCCRSQGR